MYDTIPTVCVVSGDSFAIINEADFNPSAHTRIDGPAIAEFVAAGNLASAYPPAGYASRSSDEEIAAAVAAQKGGASPIEIPADWQALHWKRRVALAEKLNADAALVTADGQTLADAADVVIAAEVERRAA